MIRRIGDGATTNICSDSWIPDAVGHKPICKNLNASAEKAAELTSGDATWNLSVIQDNLIPADGQLVTRIPLGRVGEDFWAWPADKHGIYSSTSSASSNPTWKAL